MKAEPVAARSRAPRRLNTGPPTPKQILDHLELCRGHLDSACEEIRSGTAARAQLHVIHLKAAAEWVDIVLLDAIAIGTSKPARRKT